MRRDTFEVANLHLDPENPRLPEEVRGGSEAELLSYLWRTAALDEVGLSLAENGYFPHEPLIALKAPNGYYVVEGNRRLAALKILLQEPPAPELDIAFDLTEPLTSDVRQSLERVPAFVVNDRTEVRKYLGYRHIGGIKTWSAEAKARYLFDEVEAVASADDPSPFSEVARRVGSNAMGVRNYYIAIAVLRLARAEFGLNTHHVQYERFGVWLRCMNAAGIREHVGLDSPRTYPEVRDQLERVSPEGLSEVFSDLTPSGPRAKAVLADSRDVTQYARVLRNERAHQALRTYKNLDIAAQIVDIEELPKRVWAAVQSVELLIDEAHRAEPSVELSEASTQLAALATSLQSIITSRKRVENGD